MSASKKRKGDDVSCFKRKKLKTRKESDMVDPVLNVKDAESESNTAELMSIQTIREGMLILGCVTDVKSTLLVMSLPGYLTGIIPINNISNAFTNYLTSFTDSLEFDDEPPSIESIFKVGMVFPCKVIEVLKDMSRRKPSIVLSVNPQDVNAELKPSSLYSKMILYVSVCSFEDHGYIVDVGTKCIQGFLPKNHSEDDSTKIRIGSVIPTYVKKITHSDKLSAYIQLSKLDFTDDFPEVTCDNIKLRSLLPGARIHLDVIDIKHPFVYMKYLLFDACSNILSLDRSHKNVKVGSTVIGTVLYVHPITHMIYVLLGSKPNPGIFDMYFGLRRFETVTNLSFQCFFKNRVYYKIRKANFGFIMTKDLPDKGNNKSSVSNNIPKAVAVSFHYMDNLVQMSAQKSIIEQKIVMPEDVKIGDIYDGVVRNHVEEGMFVCICPGLIGFVHRAHMSDVFITKPEVLFPKNSKIQCRVLSIDGKGKVSLTCKESLVTLPDNYVLTSYESAQCGQFYKGVIVKKTDTYILIAFFNDVVGIASTAHIPKGSVFYVGQIVLCEVLKSSPMKRKLKLSLEMKGWCSLENLDDTWDEMHSSVEEVSTTSKKILQSLSTKEKTADSKKVKEFSNVSGVVKEPHNKINNVESDIHKPIKAVIKKVKGGQLNILVNGCRGRVHITQLECISEGAYPLKKFSSGQQIYVYVFGEYERKRFLKITSKQVFFKECSLTFPPVSSKHLKPGISVIGFVKQVSDVSAVIWLSPTETGILDYLHFSNNLKVVRKVQRYLKTGLSLKVSILEDKSSTENGKCSQCFTVTKIDKSIPQVGNNILGLVQIVCLDRGLILKLPFGYHGVAALTDLTDVYAPIQSLFDKCQSQKFVLCHILEVNHQTKYCQVSLRKSRVYKKEITLDDSYFPEIFPNDVKKGDTIKGFVKSVSNTALNVVFGRHLEGKVFLHHCSEDNCTACATSKDIHTKYPIGSVVKVEVEKIRVSEKYFTLVLADSKNKVNVGDIRLSIKEDIAWDEVE